MAVRKVFQREIIEVPFSLPDGQILVHPALVLSSEELQDYEDGMSNGAGLTVSNPTAGSFC